MKAKLQELRSRLVEIGDLNAAAALLYWDQSTYMPAGAAAARGRQQATLARLAHEKLIDPAIGKLLDALQPHEQSLPYDDDDASLIRVARRQYERATKVPAAFMSEFTEHNAASYEAWAKARPANDFKAVQPYLEKTLEMSRQLANYFPGYEHIADPLIDLADYGMKANTIRPLFAELRQRMVPIVQAITSQSPADDSCVHQRFPEGKQRAFGLDAAKRFGYDLNRGRLDKTPHPFTITFSITDVRITTRFKADDLTESLFSTLHEAGHAMYEQGVRLEYDGTPLGEGVSQGVHESQSRLWENIVGRSRGFWTYFYPRLQKTFPQQLGSVPLETFYRAINKVSPSLIRTDADEVTYNLHVMIRFDLELALLEGKLSVADLPDAWHARYQSDLGVRAPDDRDGVLQDVHWYGGTIGGSFQGYTLGNILGAQFFAAATQARPQIPAEIEAGQFGALHGWLAENIYQHGSKYTPNEIIERATGGPLRIEPYIQYLRAKYGELYRL
ncbi:MAG: carboxypeptidase M32 [Chloroflexi bacterium]|nr:carboxypeptidase M32 [Chloroflexota bacterium]